MSVRDVALKEFRQVRRDRRILPFMFAVPVIQLLLFGFAVSTDIKRLELVVCDMDRSSESRQLIRMVQGSEYFRYRGDVPDLRGAGRALDTGAAKIALVIPPGYQRDIARGRTAVVQALLDGSDANAGSVASGYLGRLAQTRSAVLLENRLARLGAFRPTAGGLEPRLRLWYNPGLESALFMIPGVMAIVMGLVATSLSSMCIVREREIGTMEQLLVTPLRAWELMLGKMLPYLAVGYVNLTAILVVNALVFHVPLRGSLGLLALLTGVYLVAQVGLGLLISVTSRTQQQAQYLTAFFFMPNMLLSGFMFPIENMPDALQVVTYALPARYFIVISRAVFLRGSDAWTLLDQIVPLCALSLLLLAAAARQFHKRSD
jgi:ABC-2 type transport system permease protein